MEKHENAAVATKALTGSFVGGIEPTQELENAMGGTSSKPTEDGAKISDLSKDYGNEGSVVVTKRVVTESTIETSFEGDESGKKGVEDVDIKSCGDTGLQSGEVGSNEDGFSVLDVNASLDGDGNSEKETQTQDGEASVLGSREGKEGRVNSSVSDDVEYKGGTEAREENEGLNAGLLENMVEDDNDDDGKHGVDQEHGFAVGDFVWGKIKSHPWWPGRIYDPSDASDFALKHRQTGRLLVAFFGDGSWSWCSPSQLIPFVQNFDDMSKQSSSKSFVNAVRDAVNEFSEVVDLEMSSKNVMQNDGAGFTRPVIVNAGLKTGVLMPETSIDRLSLPMYDAAELLVKIEHIARDISIVSMIEIAFLKSWVSAFYSAKGGFRLPLFCEPQLIEGLEDKSKNTVADNNDFSVPIEVPILGPLEEDWLSSPVSGAGKPPNSEDKESHRRKQKSVAELMADNSDAKPRSKKRTTVKEGTGSAKSLSPKEKRLGANEDSEDKGNVDVPLTGKKRGRKRKADESGSPKVHEGDNLNAESDDVADGAFSAGRKRGRKRKAVISGFPTSAEKKDASVEGSGVWGGEKTNGRSLSIDVNKNDDSAHENIGPEGEEFEKVSSPRERKKSKYLSPPYTDLTLSAGRLSSKRGLDTESERFTKIARIGERVTKAAGEILTSPRLSKCSNEASENILLEGQDDRLDQSDENITDSWDRNLSVEEVLSELCYAAVHPHLLREEGSFYLVRGFVSAFRNSLYSEGSNYKIYHKLQEGMKRKSSQPEFTNGGNGAAPTKTIKAESKTSKDGQASCTALLLTFSPGSLPSREEIIQTFNKFGNLNGTETSLLAGSNTVQVMYMDDSGAEGAFNALVNHNPYGPALASYKLQRSSARQKSRGSSRRKTSSPVKRVVENQEGAQPSDEVMSDVSSIRQKLEMMMSLLENGQGKISADEQARIKDEIKVLKEKVGVTVEKVRTLVESRSS